LAGDLDGQDARLIQVGSEWFAISQLSTSCGPSDVCSDNLAYVI